MTPVEILGWACAVVGVIGFMPQPIKLMRDGNTAGLSLNYWQMMGGAIIGWMCHGLWVAKYNIFVPNLIVTFGCLFTVYLIMKARALPLVATFAPTLLLGAGLFGVEFFFGEATFGTLAAIPGVIAVLSQMLDVARAADVSGVSGMSLFMGAFLQSMWLIWGLLYPDIATAISTTIMTTLFTITFVWFLLRKGGMPAVSIGRAK